MDASIKVCLKQTILKDMFISLFIYSRDKMEKCNFNSPNNKSVRMGGQEDCGLNYVFVSGGCVSVTPWRASIAAGVGRFWCQIPPEYSDSMSRRTQTCTNDPSGLEEDAEAQ